MKNDDYAALVALDWGDKTHAFARQITGTDGIERGAIEATAEALHAWLEQLRETCGGRPVALAIEAGRNALLHALLEHPWLTVYPVHPATSARFRKAFTPSGAKDDGPDAVVILTLLRMHRDQLQPLTLDSPATRELAALVAARRSAVDQRTGTVNQLYSVLKSYFPQALTLAGDDLAKPLALAFLRRFPELITVQKARPATLSAFYREHNVRSDERIAARLALAARARPLIQDRAVIAPALLEVALLVDLLEVHARHIAGLETRIAEVFAAHPRAELFAALPGAGPKLAPRLLVAFGDSLERYPNAPKPCKNMPVWLRCAKRAEGKAGPTGAGPRQNSCVKASSNGQARQSCIATGLTPTTPSNAGPAKRTTPYCAPWPLNGSASSGAAGTIKNPTTNSTTSPPSAAKVHPSQRPSRKPEKNLDRTTSAFELRNWPYHTKC